jgi:hypothetical protein
MEESVAKATDRRPRGLDGLCDLITSFWVTRGVSRKMLGKVLHARGVRDLSEIPAAQDGTGAGEAYEELYRCAQMGGVSESTLKTIFAIELRDDLTAARLHELVRHLPDEFTGLLDQMYFMAEEFSIPAQIVRWGRIHGDLERWATASGEAQWDCLARAMASLTGRLSSVLLSTDGDGRPSVQYWSGDRSRILAEAS